MAATLTTKFNLQFIANYVNTLGLAAQVPGKVDYQYLVDLASGTGANQADKIYTEDDKSIAASGTYDIDLAGSLTDMFGAALTFAKVKLIALFAKSTNTNNVLYGNAASNQFLGPTVAAAHQAACLPGGALIFFAPNAAAWAVAGGSTDNIRLTNSSSGSVVLVDIVIVGTSA